MRIAYELSGLQVVSRGSARAAVELRRALEARHDVELVPVIAPPAPPMRFARAAWRELFWYPVGIQRRLRALEIDVLHSPVSTGPRRAPAPIVITGHDALPWDRPAWFPRRLVLHARLALGPALRKAAVVVTPSRHAGERLVAAVGVERRRIAVVPHGVSPAFSPGPVPPDLLERLGVRRPYLLSVGVLQPRKNLAGALAALERLYAEGSDHMLVVAGGRGWGEEERLARLARSPLAGRVALVGEVSDPDLVGLYRGADCLLHLSRGEGFGLPALEAMACGTPVMAASVGSLPEVVGDAGVLVSLDDPDGVARTLRELLDSPRRRQELSASGLARARAFTWGRSGELAMAAYERAISAESTVRCA